MPAWIYVVAAAAVLFVAWVAFVRRWLHSLAYSWRRARHVVALTEAEAVAAPEYGSMSLLDELAWRKEQHLHELIMRDLAEGPPGDGTFAFTVGQPDWREQTAAALSPEALGWEYERVTGERVPVALPPTRRFRAGGLVLLGPGPDPGQSLDESGNWCDSSATAGEGEPVPPAAWLDAQLAELYEWVREQWRPALGVAV